MLAEIFRLVAMLHEAGPVALGDALADARRSVSEQRNSLQDPGTRALREANADLLVRKVGELAGCDKSLARQVGLTVLVPSMPSVVLAALRRHVAPPTAGKAARMVRTSHSTGRAG